jgi:hypothetical protein
VNDDGCEVCGGFSHTTEDHDDAWAASPEADEYAYWYDVYVGG